MKPLRLPALILALLALAGCGSMSLENKRIDYQAAAVKTPSLEVPPDLTAPAPEDHYIIPGEGAAAANYSEFAKSGAATQAKANAVLPETPKVRLERSGTQRWLVVEDKAENVWPAVRAFWQENGFTIKSENPQAGLMETDWAENRAKIPKTGLRSIFGKVFDNAYDSGERDMYKIRLERSADGKSTEIHFTQYGKEEVLTADKTTFKWQPRPNDPDLEASMLQLLMVKLGGQEAQAQEAASPSAQRQTAPAARLQTAAGGKQVILLSEPFDQGWRKVGLALERAGFEIEDKDRAGGVYFLRHGEAEEKPGFFERLSAAFSRDKKAAPERYRVTVRETAAGSEVSVGNGKDESNSDTQHMTDTLYKTLNGSAQ
jgi:outer membrane protein assembly factor BamC